MFTRRILDSVGFKFSSCGQGDSDQTAWMRRLIGVLVWRTRQEVPILTLRFFFFFFFCFAFWWRFTAAKFTIRNFYNPSSQNCKPNNFLKSSSILTLMSLNSAFKHVSLLHSDNYKERLNIQNKENLKLLKK